MSFSTHPISKQSPVVICGTGGSGTRIVEQFFEKSGFFMGNLLNESKDAINFQPILGDVIQRVLGSTRNVDYTLNSLPEKLRTETLGQFKEMLDEHIGLIPDDATGWGWKNPRFIYMLPFVHAIRPDFHMVHMVRDGRDMALSDNQNQHHHFYEAMTGRKIRQSRDPVESIILWQRTNIGAVNFARRVGCKYTLVRYEDVCTPEGLDRLWKEFQLPPFDTERFIHSRTSIGRYKVLPEKDQQVLQEAGEQGLKAFGYLA